MQTYFARVWVSEYPPPDNVNTLNYASISTNLRVTYYKDFKSENEFGHTVSHHALWQGNYMDSASVVETLLDERAGVLKRKGDNFTTGGITSLYFTCSMGTSCCVSREQVVSKWRLNYRAHEDCLDELNRSPLECFVNCSTNYTRFTIKMLLDAEALLFAWERRENSTRSLMDVRFCVPFSKARCLCLAVEKYNFYRKEGSLEMAEESMEIILQLIKYALLQNPNIEFIRNTFQGEEETRNTLQEYGQKCLDEIQNISIAPNIRLGQFILQSCRQKGNNRKQFGNSYSGFPKPLVDLQMDPVKDKCLVRDALKFWYVKPYPLYREVVAALIDRDDLNENARRISLSCCIHEDGRATQIVLSCDCLMNVMTYLSDEDILNVLLASIVNTESARN